MVDPIPMVDLMAIVETTTIGDTQSQMRLNEYNRIVR